MRIEPYRLYLWNTIPAPPEIDSKEDIRAESFGKGTF
jgi:hypothetical protein